MKKLIPVLAIMLLAGCATAQPSPARHTCCPHCQAHCTDCKDCKCGCADKKEGEKGMCMEGTSQKKG